MNIQENKPLPGRATSVTIEGRDRITLTGVVTVESFDENQVTAQYDVGSVTVLGQNLHINRLDPDATVLAIGGFITGLEYTDKSQKGSFFSRLLK